MSNWYKISEIGRVQLELTNYCNAACPLCDRYEIEYLHSQGRKDVPFVNTSHLSFEQIKYTFGAYQWENLDQVHYCGCLDEPTIHPEMLDITRFFLSLNPIVNVCISTNGGTRSENFWQELGNLSKSTNGRVTVIFGIDGLEDTNHLYRRNVKWTKLENNFRTYIQHGGQAVWQAIMFPFNVDILKNMKDRADSEGFVDFYIVNTGRILIDDRDETSKKLFFGDKKLDIPAWYSGSYTYKTFKVGNVDIREIQNKKIESQCVNCTAMPNSIDDRFHPTKANIYIDYKGQVTPCCWTGNPFDLITMQQKASTERGISKTSHSIHHHSLQDIIDGPFWQFIYDEFENTRMCVNKCKKFLGDIRV